MAPGKDEKEVALDVKGHLPPALLKALGGLERDSQETGHLTLRFVQAPSAGNKFLSVHVWLSFHWNEPLLRLQATGMNGGE